MAAWPRRQRGSGGASPQLHNPPNLAKASGTFNPLCRVLCILQSLYLCAIGPMVVSLVALHLARDTPRASNCTPKQLYTWMRPRRGAGAGCSARTWSRGQFPALVSKWPVPGAFLWRATVPQHASTAPMSPPTAWTLVLAHCVRYRRAHARCAAEASDKQSL